MEIVTWPGGLQSQEIKAIEKIEKTFIANTGVKSKPAKSGSLQDQLKSIGANPMFPWKGYAGFRFVDAKGNEGEFDLLIVTHCNIIIIELKDWNNGEVTSSGDKWYKNNASMGRSPVSVTQNKVFLVKNKLEPIKHKFTNKGFAPFVDFLVVMTGNAKFAKITSQESKHTISLDDFLALADEGAFEKRFKPRNHPKARMLNKDFHLFDDLFLGKGTAPKKISVNGYKANDLIFEHPQKVYREFQAESESSRQDQALLRIWDFNNLEGVKSRTPEGRFDIVSREREVLQFIKHHDHDLYKNCLRALTSVQKDEVTSEYNEVYELPPGHIRFNQYLGSYGDALSEIDRLNLVKLLAAKFSDLHDIKVAHRDLGDHSLWLSPGKEVALSNFISAYHQPAGTVGDYRHALSVNELAVNVSPVNSGSVTPFEEDVRTLAMVSWHIFTGERMSEKSIDSLYENVSASSAWYSLILKSALDGGAYANASDFFNAIKNCEPSNDEVFDFDNSELDQYRRNINHSRQYRDDEFIVETDEKEVYLSNGQIVKAWTNVNPSEAALGYKVLHFLEKIEKLNSVSPDYLPSIRDYGIATKSSSLFLVVDKAEGVKWGELDLSEDQCLDVIGQLIAAIEHLHEIGVPHGDLHPGNILVQNTDGDIKLTIIDIPDFSLSHDERLNHLYSPENIDECTAQERDNYAVMRMSSELLDKLFQDPSKSFPAVASIINEELTDKSFGFKSLARFRDSFTAVSPQQNSLVSITLRGDFESLIVYPDNGRLYVQIDKSNKNSADARVRLIGIGGSVDFIFSASQQEFVVGFSPRLRDSVKIQDTENCQLELDFPIEIKSGSTYDLSALSKQIKDNEEFNRAIDLTLSKSDTPVTDDSLSLELKEAFKRLESLEPSIEREKIQISTRKLWQAILDTETESYPYIEVSGEPSAVSGTHDQLLIPYISDVDALGKFNKNDVVELIKIDGDRETHLGEVVLKKCALNEVRVTKTRPHTRALSDGDIVYFRTKQDKASYVKRKAALERLLERAGLIGKLVDYFDPACSLDSVKFDIDVSDEDFERYDRSDEYGNTISLNRKQRDAFTKLLQNGPLSLLQGPPGTGKTEFIAAFVHFLLEKQGVKRILLVSQSHEAVNTAAERIRKHCARLDTALDVVRFSNREGAVSTGLRDVYSGALVSEKRELFRAEVKYRVEALAKAYGVQSNYLSDVVEAELKVFSLVDKYWADVESISDTGRLSDDSLSIKQSLAELDLSIRELLESRFNILLGSDEDLSVVKFRVIEKLNKDYSIRPDESQRALALAKISRDMLGVLETDRVNYDEFFARSRQLVTGTCVGIGQRHLGIQENQYDWVIIDEAARSIASELAIAMQSGKRVLLVGDHQQLPPLYSEPHKKALARKLGISSSGGDLDGMLQSDFARVFESTYGGQTSASLLTQYRMAPEIGRLVSETFYNGKLENGERAIPNFYAAGPQFLESLVTWVDTSSLGAKSYHRSDRGVSIYNRCEADIIISMLKEIYADHQFVESLKGVVKEGEPAIGVICMYGEQKRILRQKFNEIIWSDDFKSMVKIDTVDSYQGKENRIIILSVTRSDKTQSPGFLRAPNRINVALSRAMDRLVLVGSAAMWAGKNKDLPLGMIVSLMSSFGEDEGYRFVSPEDIKTVKGVEL